MQCAHGVMVAHLTPTLCLMMAAAENTRAAEDKRKGTAEFSNVSRPLVNFTANKPASRVTWSFVLSRCSMPRSKYNSLISKYGVISCAKTAPSLSDKCTSRHAHCVTDQLPDDAGHLIAWNEQKHANSHTNAPRRLQLFPLELTVELDDRVLNLDLVELSLAHGSANNEKLSSGSDKDLILEHVVFHQPQPLSKTYRQ